ncbi:prohibitin family protein [Tenacibaculum finnmarkense genomovar finnmarkense]|uniref:Prohibitin family protein n=1 Tax=Tenacibaculum finnmarkense genomovar finnmarkense TaxID=1458503 RepID=A0AAP1RH82_9FLAO|nr:prohibitin family protein [Tenacibaculum finnmarkense]MBE7653655.1 prohibitin family protein [Tenacibaculum finnmarkense genomovar finnmarkense]MBE7661198.1 prohibitin family protein [Tenacibaculum finnmarkense genomovar finnmarkense]MBE7693266.1 prohibitin family protein [Tenacibaculum finnmarkense genomovar finnmarkense]MBE7695953.1 prohibitin family protein [Tenacibaculum finnmarkense genomovar finnmarkense]MCD8403288.1 prohibitin family protein [Tenacibaculum finnmarkense genomovar finn
MNNNRQLDFQLPKGGFLLGIIAVLGIIAFTKSTVTIKSGQAGVLYKTFSGGVVTDQPAMGEGFQIVAPWNKVFIYEVRQQEIFEKMQVLSSNGLEIQLEASAWFQPQSDKIGSLHQEKGENYISRVIQPAIRSAARSVVGRYTPEQLYSSKRDVIQTEIFAETKKILDKQFIQLNEILVRDVTLPPTIKTAIERKLKQEQESLEYEFRLVTAQKEAEKQIIEAKGKADANKILSASLTDKILQDKGIEATLKLANSPNSKVVLIGSGKSGMPIILGNQ